MDNEDILSIRNLVQFSKLNEQIGETIISKFKNVPKNIEISRKRHCFTIRFGKEVKYFNHKVKRYEVFLSFEKSEDAEGNVWALGSFSFWKFRKNCNCWGMHQIKNDSSLKRLGRIVSAFLEGNGIKLTPISKADLEHRTKDLEKLLDELISKK